MAKWSIVAYALWLLFGFTGLHHLYLGRDRQAILWITSFGGIFGLGWLVDFGRIPAYVRESSTDPAYVQLQTAYMNLHRSPPICSNVRRILAQVLFGYFYRGLVYSAIPEDLSSPALICLLAPLGTAFGTYMVSNVGGIRSHYMYAVLGAYTGEFLFGEPRLVSHAPLFSAGVGMLFSTFGWKHRRHRVKRHVCRRLAVWLLFGALFTSLCFSGLYFNAYVETDDGETVKVREAVGNFFNSEAWRNFKASFWKIWHELRKEGWDGARRSFINLADITGEDGALQTLGLEEGATMKEIKDRYQKLVKQWHPDRHQGDSEGDKLYAQERFMEIRKAYEVLSRRHGRTNKVQ